MFVYTLVRPLLRVLFKLFNFLSLGLLYLAIDVLLLNFIATLTPDMVKFHSIEWMIYTALLVNAVRFIARLFVPSRKKR
jgi:uncharacterized membrane protein YvlD (DUF360 family)